MWPNVGATVAAISSGAPSQLTGPGDLDPVPRYAETIAVRISDSADVAATTATATITAPGIEPCTTPAVTLAANTVTAASFDISGCQLDKVPLETDTIQVSITTSAGGDPLVLVAELDDADEAVPWNQGLNNSLNWGILAGLVAAALGAIYGIIGCIRAIPGATKRNAIKVPHGEMIPWAFATPIGPVPWNLPTIPTSGLDFVMVGRVDVALTGLRLQASNRQVNPT